MARGRSRAPRKAQAKGAKAVSRALDDAKVFRTGKGSSQKPAVVTLRRDPAWKKRDFKKKARDLERLGRQGKLVKTKPVRDPDVTKKYRSDTISRLTGKKRGNPAAQDRIRERFKGKGDVKRRGEALDPDHVHELQLGGADAPSNLRWMDAYTNRQIGREIAQQLKDVPYGTPVIVKVI